MRTALLSLRVYRRKHFDVIQACNPPDTYFALARLYKPFGVRFVFDHHDLCPELLISRDLDNEPPKPLMHALYALERATFATADHVITTNETYRDTARGRTRKAFDDFTVVRSAPDPALMVRGDAVPELRNGRRHLCAYLGIMGHQDGVSMVLEAADVIVNQLGRDDVQFGLLGFGDTLESLKALSTELGLDDHVTFTGRVGPTEIRDWLSTADVGLCPDPRTPFTDRSTMNKVLEYMAHEVPVVSFDLAETLRSAGPAVRPVTWLGTPEVDAKAFALAIVDLLDDPERSTAMGRQGRAASRTAWAGRSRPPPMSGPSTGSWVGTTCRTTPPRLRPQPPDRRPRAATSKGCDRDGSFVSGDVDHVLLTRFNLPSTGMEGVIRAREGWLRNRVELFERYCAPSVAGQTRPVTWIIYFDPEGPRWLMDRLAPLVDRGLFRPIPRASVSREELLSDIRASVPSPRRHLLTTNLDNDDGLAVDFSERVTSARYSPRPRRDLPRQRTGQEPSGPVPAA